MKWEAEQLPFFMKMCSDFFTKTSIYKLLSTGESCLHFPVFTLPIWLALI